MRKLLAIPICLLLLSLTGCYLLKGHYTADGSMWVWDKDPNGRYNAHSELQLNKANQWIETVINIPKLTNIRVYSSSRKNDNYTVNDSVMFFDLKRKELPNYHSYHTFANRLQTDPELLKKIVLDFDKLGLNRFYREDEFMAFTTASYLNYSAGYFYFFDTAKVANVQAGSIIHFTSDDYKYFRSANYDRFLILKVWDAHWVEWEEYKSK